MILDTFLRFLVDLGWLIGILAAVFVGSRMGRRLARGLSRSRLMHRIRARRARSRPTPAPVAVPFFPPRSASLLVRTEGEVLLPSVQLLGDAIPDGARVRLELVDDDGRVHPGSARRLTPSMLGTEFPLPPFRPPEGGTLKEALGWIWRVELEEGSENLHLLSERPRPMGGLTREAEIRYQPGI